MMVKSISQLSRGRYNFKKKKVWINLFDDQEIEYEAEIIDISEYSIFLYNKNGKLILHKKEKQHFSILV